MILHKPKKIMVLFNAKTGSRSLRQLISTLHGENPQLTIPEKGMRNAPIRALPRIFPDEDVSGYRVLSFYRDPIERFLSSMEHHQTKNPQQFPRGMSIAEFFDANGGFMPQTTFLNPEGFTVELFDFRDFSNEVVRLASELGYTINANRVPKINESGPGRKNRTELTEDEIQLIKDRYAVDYEFFASRDITF